MKDKYVSRAGEKLQAALENFNIKIDKLVCADFGVSTGGFTDCLLSNGASKVYAVDTAKGELAWTLRTNPFVVVMESQNAVFVNLPEKVDFISIDTGWTRQKVIIESAIRNIKPKSDIITLIKPQYEASRDMLIKGKVNPLLLDNFIEKISNDLATQILGRAEIKGLMKSPVLGDKAQNTEYLMWIKTL